jgi:hypothetical protein
MVPQGSAEFDAEGWETIGPGVSNRARAFVEKVSGSRSGCP